MLRQKSPTTMAANAQGQYVGNQLGQQKRISRSPGIAGSYIVNTANTVNTVNAATTTGFANTVTTTSISTATLTTAVSAVNSVKGSAITVKKGEQEFISPADVNMVTLRSGKQFSPSRSGTPKQQRQSVGRKRSQTPDSAERIPHAKRRDIEWEGNRVNLGVPTTLFRSQSESDLQMTGEPLGVVVQKAVDSSLEKFLKHMESVMDKKLEKCLQEVKSETKKCSDDIEQVKTQVTAIERCTDSVRTNLTDFKNDVGEKITGLGSTLENMKMNENDMLKRIEELERKVARTRPEGNQEPDKYPLGKTLIMKRVLLEDGLQPLEAVRLIINDALRLPAVRVLDCEVMRTFPNGHNTIKVLLGTNEDLRQVMKTKHILGKCAVKEVKAVWILQAKSADQRRHEYNNAMLIKQLQLEDKLRQMGSGHLVPVETNGNDEGPSTPNRANAVSIGDTENVGNDREDISSGRGEPRTSVPRGRGRGRVYRPGRGRGRGEERSRGSRDHNDRVPGPRQPEDPYVLSEAVRQAFVRSSRKTPNASPNVQTPENMEINTNSSD